MPYCKIAKTTVYALVFSFIKFSAIEIRSVFSYKAFHLLITKNGKKDEVPVLVGELELFFQLTELTVKTIPPRFQCLCARVRANDAVNYAQ